MIEIDVVHAMKAPQKRDAVGEDVPDVERVVEHHRSKSDFHHRWQIETWQKAPAALVNSLGQWRGKRLFSKPNGDRSHHAHREIAGIMTQLVFARTPKRSSMFKPKDRRQCA